MKSLPIENLFKNTPPLKGIVATDVTTAISPLGTPTAVGRAFDKNVTAELERLQAEGRAGRRGLAGQRGSSPLNFIG